MIEHTVHLEKNNVKSRTRYGILTRTPFIILRVAHE